MKRLISLSASFFCLAVLLVSCSSQPKQASREQESREAKQLLQGIWIDDETESLVFQLQGDSVYYPDSTSMPAYFYVVGDTLYMGSSASYHIEKQTEHILWIQALNGEVLKLTKDQDNQDGDVFKENKAQIQTVTEVQKRDTVVFYQNTRYHLYLAINPTRYKVVRTTLNEDGMEVENVYYDNILHVSVFEGSKELFSKDIRKQQFSPQLSETVLSQSVLNDISYASADAKGLHFRVSLCVPGNASCYVIEHVISFDGKLSTQLLEY